MSCTEGLKRLEGPVCIICGAPFTSVAGGDHHCAECIALKTPRPYVKARSALYYSESTQEAVKLLKYNNVFSLALPLAERLALAAGVPDDDTIVVPVPLHKRRLVERGFNQSLLLARELARILGLELEYRALKRIKLTRPQVELKGSERMVNVKGAFEVTDPSFFVDKKVLLIDDVYTTGATITECAGVLKEAGATVSALTLARTAYL